MFERTPVEMKTEVWPELDMDRVGGQKLRRKGDCRRHADAQIAREAPNERDMVDAAKR
jgi:hypothetical protein